MKTLVYKINDRFGKLAFIVESDEVTHTPTVYKVEKISFDEYESFLEETQREKDTQPIV